MSFILGGIALAAGASVGVAAGAAVVGSTLYGAYQGGQQGAAYDAASAAAGKIKKEKLDLFFHYFNNFPEFYKRLILGIFGSIYGLKPGMDLVRTKKK